MLLFNKRRQLWNVSKLQNVQPQDVTFKLIAWYESLCHPDDFEMFIVLCSCFSRERVVTELDSSLPILCRGSGQERECGVSYRAFLATEREDTWPWENPRFTKSSCCSSWLNIFGLFVSFCSVLCIPFKYVNLRVPCVTGFRVWTQ